jgi:hypothetical protein
MLCSVSGKRSDGEVLHAPAPGYAVDVYCASPIQNHQLNELEKHVFTRCDHTCLLFGASACTSNAHRTDSVKVEGVPVFATDTTGENFIRLDGGESGKRKMKCRTEIPTGSHIPKKTCYWEDDLERASYDAKRMLNSVTRNSDSN